jgi:hypothetical protein
MLRERGASAGVSDQLWVTRSQVPTQRSETRVSTARLRETVDGAEGVSEEEVDEEVDEEVGEDGEEEGDERLL